MEWGGNSLTEYFFRTFSIFIHFVLSVFLSSIRFLFPAFYGHPFLSSFCLCLDVCKEYTFHLKCCVQQSLDRFPWGAVPISNRMKSCQAELFASSLSVSSSLPTSVHFTFLSFQLEWAIEKEQVGENHPASFTKSKVGNINGTISSHTHELCVLYFSSCSFVNVGQTIDEMCAHVFMHVYDGTKTFWDSNLEATTMITK